MAETDYGLMASVLEGFLPPPPENKEEEKVKKLIIKSGANKALSLIRYNTNNKK